MVVLEFLDCMETELNKLFEGMVFDNSTGGKSGMHVLKQDFPIRKYKVDEKKADEKKKEIDLFPYCIIRVEDGTAASLQTVDIAITIGICEKGEENNGELRILNLIERVCQRFLNDRVIGGKFRLDYDVPIRWGLPKDEKSTYPYFYGLIEMTWDSFFETEEDRYV